MMTNQGPNPNLTSTEDCAECGGSGWRTIPARTDAEGKVRPQQVTRCACRIGARGERLLEQARIPARYEHCSLESFKIEFDGQFHNSIADAKLIAGRFVEEYPVRNTGLLFIGPVGTGKTHLAVGIMKLLMEQKGVRSLFYDYRELLKEIQNSYNANVNATELGILRPVFDADLLVLDELGAVKPSEWVWDTVSLIINSRYNEKKTTIITTNYPNRPPAAAEAETNLLKKVMREETLGDRVGERMRSRLHEMCRIVEITGEDYRQHYKSATPGKNPR
jgi:DNA replication protein DnaC